MQMNKINFGSLIIDDQIKKTDLLSFFNAVGYDWKKDQETIKNICYYTKSRANPHKKDFELSYGMEQPFLIKAVAEWTACESFFEVGTGRGTACYSVSLLEHVKKISTVDIVPFNVKRNDAIGYEPAFVSNEDLYGMIPYDEKQKIEFYQRNQVNEIITNSALGFDLFFIDGDHTNHDIIFEDFKICHHMEKENSIFVWDDYDPEKFAIKGVIRQIKNQYPEYDFLLIEFRGHLFGDKQPEKNAGMVLMKKGKFDEDLFAKSE
jgi:hypothetical protein